MYPSSYSTYLQCDDNVNNYHEYRDMKIEMSLDLKKMEMALSLNSDK